MLFRENSGLLLRKGKPGANGGATFASLAASANAEGGKDYSYAPVYWSRAELPMVLGTPDTNGDGVPDVWTVGPHGIQYLFPGAPTTMPGTPSGSDDDGWTDFLTIG
ncbi:hypothetical protein ACLF6K_09355 [Streptomyces xanthophaeus]|uniref:hypothetical protein n=1 Tax=Streptomyces xanthophaeus TaxID=67385 RepID=UPI00398FF5FE